MENHVSTWFIQLALVGVKWRWKRCIDQLQEAQELSPRGGLPSVTVMTLATRRSASVKRCRQSRTLR
jgi:hypothetical protein